MNHPPVIWLLGDGKPGHQNQSLGLADAVARRVACDIHRIDLSKSNGFFGRLRLAVDASRSLPKPDVIIAAGHTTHFALWWLARKTGAKSVVLMRPSLPLACFDLCIAPEHDFPNGCDRADVVLTRGALNRVTPCGGEKNVKLILIGGPSKTHGWDGDQLLEMLSVITADGNWILTDSRRTPSGFLDQLSGRLPTVRVFSHTQTAPDWLPDNLIKSSEVWVTEDSVSMIYEALTSGARVGLLPVPRLKESSRVLSGIDRLVGEKFLTLFSSWSVVGRMDAPPEGLREADRCAEILVDRLNFNFSFGGDCSR